MKFVLSFFMLVFHICDLNAQNYQVQGVVVNEADNKPIADASVFINNGSKGTVTDNEGRFVLNGIGYNSFELVVSHVGYETLVIDINPDNIEKRFRVKLAARKNELEEVIIEPIEKDGWKKWGKTFVENFLGNSENASDCHLLNPETLIFRYNKKTGLLKVSAREQLKIRNNALGYKIKYQLEQFEFDYANKAVTFLGYINFEDMDGSKWKTNQWKRARQTAYNGSMMHFMRSFYEGKLSADGFSMRQLIRLNKKDTSTRKFYDQILRYDYTGFDTSKFAFNLVKSSAFSDPVIHITGKKLLSADSIKYHDSTYQHTLMYFNNDVQVLYAKELESKQYLWAMGQPNRPGPQTSIFYFRSNMPVVVQSNGLFFEPLNIYTEGYWAFEKLAELLPSDYGLE